MMSSLKKGKTLCCSLASLSGVSCHCRSFSTQEQYLQPMTNDDIISCLNGQPHGPDCGGLYTSTIKGCREYFSADVVGAIHVRMHRRPSVDPIPASITPPAECVLRLIVGIVDWHRITIEEAGLAGIALFGDDDRDP